jgi:hypothetical protein
VAQILDNLKSKVLDRDRRGHQPHFEGTRLGGDEKLGLSTLNSENDEGNQFAWDSEPLAAQEIRR